MICQCVLLLFEVGKFWLIYFHWCGNVNRQHRVTRGQSGCPEIVPSHLIYYIKANQLIILSKLTAALETNNVDHILFTADVPSWA